MTTTNHPQNPQPNANIHTVPRLYSVQELTELGFGTRSKIDELVRQGKIKKLKIGRSTRFSADEINRFLAQANG